jgi:anti-anti-sigma factor
MEVTCLTSESRAIIRVRGSIELRDVDLLRGLVEELGQPSVIIDLSSVEHIHFRCSAKLRALCEHMRSVGGTLEIRGASPYVAGILAVGGFEDIFDFVPSGRSVVAGG